MYHHQCLMQRQQWFTCWIKIKSTIWIHRYKDIAKMSCGYRRGWFCYWAPGHKKESFTNIARRGTDVWEHDIHAREYENRWQNEWFSTVKDERLNIRNWEITTAWMNEGMNGNEWIDGWMQVCMTTLQEFW